MIAAVGFLVLAVLMLALLFFIGDVIAALVTGLVMLLIVIVLLFSAFLPFVIFALLIIAILGVGWFISKVLT